MANQHYGNHMRLVPAWHFVTSLLILGAFIGSIVNLSESWHNHDNLYSASLICLVIVILGIYFVFIRSFPLKTQDRAIRAEENLRHFVMTGKLMDSRLRPGQIIALRFASDEEYLPLAHRAVEEGLSPKEIKKSIKNWRADHRRV